LLEKNSFRLGKLAEQTYLCQFGHTNGAGEPRPEELAKHLSRARIVYKLCFEVKPEKEA
jgi:hypothetical protein